MPEKIYHDVIDILCTPKEDIMKFACGIYRIKTTLEGARHEKIDIEDVDEINISENIKRQTKISYDSEIPELAALSTYHSVFFGTAKCTVIDSSMFGISNIKLMCEREE